MSKKVKNLVVDTTAFIDNAQLQVSPRIKQYLSMFYSF